MGWRCLALWLLLVSSCAAPERLPPSLRAGFVAGSAVIEVQARDPLPLRAAELLLPDGAVLTAGELASTLPPPPRPSEPLDAGVGVGVVGGSRGGVDTAVLVSLPVDFSGLFRRRRPPELIESRARFAISDLGAYRLAWPAARLRLTLGDPPGPTRVVELPAPPPPER